jgi:cobalt-zinc-cadmium efflux system protein
MYGGSVSSLHTLWTPTGVEKSRENRAAKFYVGQSSAGDEAAHAGHDHDSHSHGHHDHAHDLRRASRRSLILITTYMVAEAIGGILSGSLALLADARHMLTDAAAIVMALVAIWISQKEASAERTFGYHRTEILAALATPLPFG